MSGSLVLAAVAGVVAFVVVRLVWVVVWRYLFTSRPHGKWQRRRQQ